MIDVSETVELPPAAERELRAKWFLSLSEDERLEMIHRPFLSVEAMFAAWRSRHGTGSTA